jgi:uncharacterized protein YciI|tara:strand:+ start:141 stop:464 length:324 start_codon:yes stop_codon:yes gene_type:complete
MLMNILGAIGQFTQPPSQSGLPVHLQDTVSKQKKSKLQADHNAFVNSLNDDGPAKLAGPTPDQLIARRVAAKRAEKRAARKRIGKARRKKYEAARTMAQKMKLIFVD